MPVAAPAQEVGAAPGPYEMFQALPIITRCWFGTTLVLTVAGNFKIISPYNYVFLWQAIAKKFEIWRFATCFCYAGGFDFNTLIAIYMLVSFSKQYENGGPFNTGAGGGTADYAFALIFCAIGCFVTYPFLSNFLMPIFCRQCIYFIVYIWSKCHHTAQANIWGVPMPAIYLPFAYLALTIFMGNGYYDMIHGFALGHLYYFIVDVVPQVYGKDFLKTPMFLIDYFGTGQYTPNHAAAAPARVNNTTGAGGAAGGRGGHDWGSGGRALGR